MYFTKMMALLLVVIFAAGCKDDTKEMVCDKNTGVCSVKSVSKEVVEVEEPLFQRMSKVSEADQPVNQGFAPIHESQIMNQEFMTLAGNEGGYNDVEINEVEIPGLGHTEAAISGSADYVRKSYKENLWPGGVEQGAELDLGEF